MEAGSLLTSKDSISEKSIVNGSLVDSTGIENSFDGVCSEVVGDSSDNNTVPESVGSDVNSAERLGEGVELKNSAVDTCICVDEIKTSRPEGSDGRSSATIDELVESAFDIKSVSRETVKLSASKSFNIDQKLYILQEAYVYYQKLDQALKSGSLRLTRNETLKNSESPMSKWAPLL